MDLFVDCDAITHAISFQASVCEEPWKCDKNEKCRSCQRKPDLLNGRQRVPGAFGQSQAGDLSKVPNLLFVWMIDCQIWYFEG